MLTGATSRRKRASTRPAVACIHEIKPVKLPRCASPMARSLVAIAASVATCLVDSSERVEHHRPARRSTRSARRCQRLAQPRLRFVQTNAARGNRAASCSVAEGPQRTTPALDGLQLGGERAQALGVAERHATSLRASSTSATWTLRPAREPASCALAVLGGTVEQQLIGVQQRGPAQGTDLPRDVRSIVGKGQRGLRGVQRPTGMPRNVCMNSVRIRVSSSGSPAERASSSACSSVSAALFSIPMWSRIRPRSNSTAATRSGEAAAAPMERAIQGGVAVLQARSQGIDAGRCLRRDGVVVEGPHVVTGGGEMMRQGRGPGVVRGGRRGLQRLADEAVQICTADRRRPAEMVSRTSAWANEYWWGAVVGTMARRFRRRIQTVDPLGVWAARRVAENLHLEVGADDGRRLEQPKATGAIPRRRRASRSARCAEQRALRHAGRPRPAPTPR